MKEYTFTGYYPSGNPFLWLYDENKHTMFTNSITTATWDKEPKKGDKITMHDDGRVFINGELVSDHSPERAAKHRKITDDIYDELKRSKGLK